MTEPITTITTDEAEDYVYDNVAVQLASEHRWYDRQLIVFKDDDGSLQGFYYLRPKTEEQEGQDRYESDPVKVFAVVGKEVTSTIYEVA